MFKNIKANISSSTIAKTLLAVAFSFSTSAVVFAQSTQELIIERLSKSNQRVQVESVTKTPWKGMYEVALKSGEIIFSDEKAEYLVVGQLLNLTDDNGIVNLSEQKFQVKVAKTLAQVPDEEQIIYPATGEEKAVVTVFTDISCYYCKKLHKAIPELQSSGVTVKYMAFPRAGLGSDVETQMSSIWCAKDKLKALSMAKDNGTVKKASCDSPVASQFKLGHKLGVNATPTLFTEEGVKISGFASAQSLLQDLNVTN